MTTSRSCLVALAVLFAAGGEALSANLPHKFDDLTRAADKVVIGTLGAKTSRWANEARICTDILIQADVTIKGEDELVVLVEALGGTVNDTVMEVSGGPEFPDGERVLVFLKREAGRWTVLGGAAGVVRAESAEATEAVESAFATAEESLGRRLEWERGLAAGAIQRAVAEPVSGGSGQTPEKTNCYRTDDAQWPTRSVTYKIGQTIPDAWQASIDAAARTWNNAGAGFQLVNDPGSPNEVSFKDLAAAYGSAYAETLVLTTTWSNRTTGAITGATIEVNSGHAWTTSGEENKADVQNLLTREFGYLMGLRDVYSPSGCSEVTMWGYAGYGETKKQTLEQEDLNGLRSLTATTDSTVLAPELTAPSNGATGVSRTPNLLWTASTNATSYDVYIGTSASPGLAGSITGTSAVVSTLTAGATYYWRVVAKNATTSASSAISSFTVAGIPPASPTLTAPPDGATSVAQQVTLQWGPSAGATSYDIYLGTSATPPQVTTVTGTTHQSGALLSGATYYWRVVARNASGTATSATYSFTVAPGSSGPTLISPSSGASGVSLRPAMQWSAVPGATTYDLYVGTTAAPGYIGSVSAVSVTVTGFRPSTTYYWKVVARTTSGTLSSTVASFQTGT